MKVNLDELQARVDKKLISKQKHPHADLWIYNYTPIAQFSRAWDEYTLMARGLILDAEGNIVARPFTKFFNYGEYEGEIPTDEQMIVTEKMDGSLGIMYWLPNDPWPRLATRGSFTSEQALKGTEILLTILRATHPRGWLNNGLTYLFEIIYPQNRIVINYGTQEKLVLLAVNDAKGRGEVDIEDYRENPIFPFEVVSTYPAKAIEELTTEHRDNAEGYVLHWPKAGLRLKIKHDEYVRLHRIVTGVSNKSIWEVLRQGESFDEILDNIPDEFYDWVSGVRDKLQAQHDKAIATAAAVYDQVDKTDRKAAAQAMAGTDNTTRAIVFALLDGKTDVVHNVAWKSCKPQYEQPFKKDIDA